MKILFAVAALLSLTQGGALLETAGVEEAELKLRKAKGFK